MRLGIALGFAIVPRMQETQHIYQTAAELGPVFEDLRPKLAKGTDIAPVGVAGFDGFIDTFIRMRAPATMAEFGPKVRDASGIAASYTADHIGDKFGGNGPLLATAVYGAFGGRIDHAYIGAMGRESILPVFLEALEEKTEQLYSLADPAHSDCLEFDDGKVMLSDLRSCEAITWERLLEVVPPDELKDRLERATFIAAVNWGKLPHVGAIWSGLAEALEEAGREPKTVQCFMDLAEFEQRPAEQVETLLQRLPGITRQCHSILSFNLKEAWQMGERFGGHFKGRKDPASVAELAALLRASIDVDRIVIHPNDGAACSSEAGTVYVPGPFCRQPLISTGAGDHFGAGCLAGSLLGLDDTGILLTGVAASGYFVRSGASPDFGQMLDLFEAWQEGSLPERL